MSIKPWLQVAVPHKDIREERLDEAVFAANLGDVVRDKGPLYYRDPETFFRKTHFTAGLKKLIGTVLSRLLGDRKGNSVIQIKTPFGGGKTHALIALYHIIKNSEKIMHLDQIREILENKKIKDIPEINTVIFVGEYGDPLKGKTLWGEIGHQLGCYDIVEEYDRKRVAPGKDIISDILSKKKPVLIIIDELVQYLVRAMGVKVEEGTLKGQTQAFIKALTEVISSEDRCVIIATLPSSIKEGYEEAERAARALLELQNIFGRMEKIHVPVEDLEIYEIIRKRLFEDIGDISTHRAVADEYINLYNRLGDDIPSEYKETSYRDRIISSYPFHPELIDTLYERWSTIPTFQRTRGVLRLLAEIISDLYKREHPAPLIQPAHINLANTSIRNEFIKHVGNEYEGVIASDIAGHSAKAPEIDREIGTEYTRFGVAKGLSTSIFFYSFSGGERRGTTTSKLRLALLREGIPPTIIEDGIRRLENMLWYLHTENGLYYFSNIIGLNRVIIDKIEGVKHEEIKKEIGRRVRKNLGRDFTPYIWPKQNRDIPDNKTIKLIVLPYELTIDKPETEEFISDMIQNYLTGFRSFKNSLIFLISDQYEYDAIIKKVRRYLALKSITEHEARDEKLTSDDEERLYEMQTEIGQSIEIISGYRHLAKASKEGFQTFDMGIPIIGEDITLTKRVKDYLKEQEMLLDRVSPKVLLEKTFSEDDDEKSISKIWEGFVNIPGMFLLENESVLTNSVIRGVREGFFGLKVGDKIYYKNEVSTSDISEDALIIRKEIAEELLGLITPVVQPIEIEPSGPKPQISPPLGTIGRYHLIVKVPWDRLSDMVRGVFRPLSSEGAQISLEIKIDAQSEKGISRDTIDLKIKETLNQIEAEIIKEEEK